eukprot:scaffold8976_cov173-Skeletonema_marinoi.AAC.1
MVTAACFQSFQAPHCIDHCWPKKTTSSKKRYSDTDRVMVRELRGCGGTRHKPPNNNNKSRLMQPPPCV